MRRLDGDVVAVVFDVEGVVFIVNLRKRSSTGGGVGGEDDESRPERNDAASSTSSNLNAYLCSSASQVFAIFK